MKEVNNLISKEIEKKIDYLIQAEDQDLVSWDDDGKVINIQYLKDIKAYIEKLEKDVDILKILKKIPFCIYSVIEVFGNKYWRIKTKESIVISKEEYKKIKEWLENDYR